MSSFTSLWSRTLPATTGGLSLARERNWLLTWDHNHWLYLLDQAGRTQAQRQFLGLSCASAADDGSAYAAGSHKGEVWFLAPDLMPRWEKKLPRIVRTVALDPFGQYLAAADNTGQVTIFTATGQQIGQLTLPRALRFLVFLPMLPLLVGSADLGLVAAFNLHGEVVWRDGLVANVGGLCVPGDGRPIVLACFSEGLQRYSPGGENQGKYALGQPCRLVSQSFDGQRLLVADLENQLTLLDRLYHPLATHELPLEVKALTLGALGKDACVALADGTVTRLQLE